MASARYARLLAMYKAGFIDDAYLTRAVAVGWITEDEKAEIIASVSGV